MKILVIKGKHGNDYYEASTPSQQVAAAWLCLKDRWDNGWFGDPTEITDWNRDKREKDKQLLALTQADIDRIPEVARAETLAQIAKAKTRQLERDDEAEEYFELKRIIEERDISFELRTVNGRSQLKSPVWDAFRRRGDYEYEGYQIVDISDPLEAFHAAAN